MFRMRTMLSLALGYSAGYIAGAKAGRPAYERLMASVDRYGQEFGLKPAGRSSTALANEEIGNLRQNQSQAPGRPDEGRSHGPTVAP